MFNKYNYGLVVGRFQPLHYGHQRMIDLALNLCQEVIIFIGSSQESGTMKNPFSYDVRKKMIEIVYKDNGLDRLEIKPLPDLRESGQDDTVWGNYVIDQYVDLIGGGPEVFIYGDDNGQRSTWFTDEQRKNMVEIIIPRKMITTSGTELRNALLNDNQFYWSVYTDNKLSSYYSFLRDIMKGVNTICSTQNE